MIPCIMIGDSIAVGVGQARPECETVARVGISSSRYISTLLPPGRTSAGTAVISLGVNDGDTTDTLDNLREVRSRISASAVVWLLPGLKEEVRDMIRTVAAENNDRTLDTRPQVGRDHLHPTGRGYETIASAIIGPGAGYGYGMDPAVEVAYAPDEPRRSAREEARRPLHRFATPVERIRRLRTIRHAEGLRVAGARVSRPVHGGRHAGSRTVSAKAATRLVTGCTGPRPCHGRPLRG